MLTKKMEEALNGQLNAELYSSYLYLAMGAYLDAAKRPGMSHWMREQAKEEQIHGMKLFDYLAQNGRVKLSAIEAPPGEWSSPLAVFEAVLAHEKKVTGLINGLVQVAKSEQDAATERFLAWFVKEQEEEEESAEKAIKLMAAAKDAQGLAAVDAELGRR